ncbi:MAG: hypothetical protein ACXW5U_16340 [Thermoanaerobaculia bacterium]
MSYFVNEYASGAASLFRAIVSADASGFRVVGTWGDGGLLAAIRPDGTMEWQKVYIIRGRFVRFFSGVRCDDGDLMLHGSLASGDPQRNQSLILRVRPDGGVRWANAYTRDRTRFNVRLVKGVEDTYYFFSWYTRSGSSDDVEVVKIDGSGNVLAAVGINSGGDDQPHAIIPWKDGCVIAGGTSSGPGWDGFVIVLDGALQPVWSKLIGDADFQEIRDIVETYPDVFVVTGETGANRNSFVASLSMDDSGEVFAVGYDLRAGNESGTKRLATSKFDEVYLAATVTSAPLTSFVASFGFQFSWKWQRNLSLPGSSSLLDIRRIEGTHDLVVCGSVTNPGAPAVSLLACTNGAFESCVATSLPRVDATSLDFHFNNWAPDVAPVDMTVTSWDVTVRDVTPAITEICPPGIEVELENARFQSPYIYLQAGGSDFSDQTVRGFHLRWDLLRRLGDSHLPKGNLAAPGSIWPTTIGYNRADDFVRIYRTQLKDDYGVTVNFGEPPTSIFESGPAREWLYEDLVPSPDSDATTDVSIRFTDVAKYDALRATIDPLTSPELFFPSYTGAIEARAVGKLAFAATFVLQKLQNMPGERLRTEAIALPDPLDNASRQLACRRSFTPSTTQLTPATIVCENIESVHFDFTGLVPVSLRIATYEDFLVASSARREWSKIGDFSLDDGNADADAAVFKRLEDPPKVGGDGVWPKFRSIPASPDVFRISAKNYRDRWQLPKDGVKKAVTTYLDASRTDVKANVTVPNADPVANSSEMELSYLDLLNFVSLDYHVARMLGLGTIDPQPAAGPAARFIYLMQYVTEAQLEHETAARVTHCYMTPPIGITDFRKPPAPSLTLSYGLPPENCGGVSSPLTDPAGYAFFDDVRFVNLDRAPFSHEGPPETFFQTPTEFCLCEQTVPVAFGVKYGPGPVGSGNDVQPELSHNPDWLDPAGVAEVSPIPDRGANPVYTHQERSAGIHHYRLYSINWFSRSGDLSNEVQTDATKFAPRNTLLPPSNFAVQLIQKEDPRIFTSEDEQKRLSLLPAGDKTLVRVTFDWNHIQNHAYQSADKVDLYFRTKPPGVVRGEIASVTEDAATHTATITTKLYLIPSTDPAGIVQPEITALEKNRYVGARLSVEGRSWLVDSIVSTGLNPTLVLKQIRNTTSKSADLNHSFCTLETWVSPKPDDRFLIAENLDDAAAWDMKLDKEVALAKFTPPYTETIVHNDGQSRTIHVGGLTGAAFVQAVPDPDPNIGKLIPAYGPLSVPSGAYTVTFVNKQLPAIADPDVEFHEGVIRMPGLDGAVKLLRVWKIGKNNTQQLELTVYDSELAWQRDSAGKFVLDANKQFVPVAGCLPVLTGNVASVNFHPSYRVYLKADLNGNTDTFGEPAMLPARGEGSRQTFMTARSRDSLLALTSPMARTAPILARELREPVIPGPPLGPLFATRPNFYGKATYTFDVQVDDPDSLIFYKANDRKILDQLYKPETVRSIVAELDAMGDFDLGFTSQRWHDLVHAVTGSDGHFLEHTLNGFQFPVPDNPLYAIPEPRPDRPRVHPFNGTTPPGSSTTVGTTGRTMKEIVKEAIDGAFVPLTELPLVYRQLTNTTLQTSGRPPRVRNANGDRIPPSNIAEYDPWPMAVRYEKNANGELLTRDDAGYGSPGNTRWVRFTDHTIDGASKNFYFYYAVELTHSLKISGSSSITGPVQLVNAAPPEAPAIRKVTARLVDGADVTEPRVDFSLTGYLPSEGVVLYRLYRALDADAALSVRTMTELKDFPVDAAEIYDDFSDLGFVPFAQPIYYRAVAFRRIVNEQSQPELVPSKASNVATTNVADTVNPAPPPITRHSDPLTTTHPFQYKNVRLEWPRTTYKGRYHLFKLNDVGIWVKIATVDDAPIMQVKLQDTTLGTDVLLKEDEDDNTLYHRFRVTVENSSGLINLTQNELTV